MNSKLSFFADIAQFYIIIFIDYANAECKNNLQHRLQVGLRCFILVVENKTTAAYNQAKERKGAGMMVLQQESSFALHWDML